MEWSALTTTKLTKSHSQFVMSRQQSAVGLPLVRHAAYESVEDRFGGKVDFDVTGAALEELL
jgi:hypothetical protein